MSESISSSVLELLRKAPVPHANAETEYVYLEDAAVSQLMSGGLDSIPAAGEVLVHLVLFQVRRDLGDSVPYLVFYMLSGSEAAFPTFPFRKPQGDGARTVLINDCLNATRGLAKKGAVSHVSMSGGSLGRGEHFRGLHVDGDTHLAFLDMRDAGFSALSGGFPVCVDELLNIQRAGPARIPVSPELTRVFLRAPRLAMLVEKTETMATLSASVSPVPYCVIAQLPPAQEVDSRPVRLKITGGEQGPGFYFLATANEEEAAEQQRFLINPLNPVYVLPGEEKQRDATDAARAVYFISAETHRPAWKVPNRSSFVLL